MKRFFPVLLLLTGLSLLLYPTISHRLTTAEHSRTLEAYRTAVSRMEPDARERLLEGAEAQNSPALLTVEDSGIIGYVTIPKLQIELPLYPNTCEEALRNGAGLLEGSSLPLGGAGCHSILSAHRGLPEARLFTDLDKLSIGDAFSLTILDRTITYQVDQILTVLPQDTAALLPQADLDLCTLLTCTPYGINSHRLLVRGRRV